MNLSDTLGNLREITSGPVKGTGTDLRLTREEFMAKMEQETDGLQLLYLLEDGEWRIAERMGQIDGYRNEDGEVMFYVPDWKTLV